MAAVSSEFIRFIVPAENTARRGSGFFSRVMATVRDARMREAEKEIARMIELRGGRPLGS